MLSCLNYVTTADICACKRWTFWIWQKNDSFILMCLFKWWFWWLFLIIIMDFPIWITESITKIKTKDSLLSNSNFLWSELGMKFSNLSLWSFDPQWLWSKRIQKDLKHTLCIECLLIVFQYLNLSLLLIQTSLDFKIDITTNTFQFHDKKPIKKRNIKKENMKEWKHQNCLNTHKIEYEWNISVVSRYYITNC